ncbi:MAG: sigma-70 family RNA polymerase sigma factor [Planctomycetes bacterium]|nr:sigma-70 family RNA polymerase sigma factor [Planctomycetota bacterium]
MSEEFEIETTRHVRDAIQGETNSIAWLVERFTPFLHAQAIYRLGPVLAGRVSSDDIVQEAWLAVLPRLAEIVAREGRTTPVLLTYLSKVVCGRAVNHLRSHLRRSMREVPLPESTHAGVYGRDEHVFALVQSVTRQARASEFGQLLTEALEQLPEAEREVLVLRLVEGRSNAEVAAELGERPNTVSQRYRRALLALRARLPPSLLDDFLDT